MKKIQGPLKGMIHDTQLSASDIVFNNIQLLNGTRIVCLDDFFQPCLEGSCIIGSIKLVKL